MKIKGYASKYRKNIAYSSAKKISVPATMGSEIIKIGRASTTVRICFKSLFCVPSGAVNLALPVDLRRDSALLASIRGPYVSKSGKISVSHHNEVVFADLEEERPIRARYKRSRPSWPKTSMPIPPSPRVRQ